MTAASPTRPAGYPSISQTVRFGAITVSKTVSTSGTGWIGAMLPKIPVRRIRFAIRRA